MTGQAERADADLSVIEAGNGTVFGFITEPYFHQLRLRVAEKPELAKKIAVFWMDEQNALHPVGLSFEDELNWPSGFCNESWEVEAKIHEIRRTQRK